MTDLELLQHYVRTGSNDAFAAIVAQHLGWVFASALRQTNSRSLAEEIAQAVFLDLAQHATKLRADTQLGSWLCVVTRRTAVDVLRRESRRRQREQTAVDLAAMNADEHDWTHAEPVIDEALAALDETDRRAVVLRFFEQRSLGEIGATLGVSEDAAQKRVTRALDRLRGFLQHRGIATTTAALGAGLAASGQVAAPVGLATTIVTALPTAMALGAASSGVLSTFALTTTKKVLLSAAATLAFGGLVVGAQLIDSQRDKIARLRAELYAARPATLEVSAGNRGPGIAATADPIAARLDELAERVALLKRMLAASPEHQIPELAALTEKDWVEVASRREPRTATDFRRGFSELRELAKRNVFSPIGQQLRKYVENHQGEIPASVADLVPLLHDPLQQRSLAHLEFVNRGNVRNLPRDAAILQERAAHLVDREYDRAFIIQSRGTTWAPSPALNRRLSSEERRINEAADFAALAFARDHGGRKPDTMKEILPYFRDPNDAADFKYAFEQLKGTKPKQ